MYDIEANETTKAKSNMEKENQFTQFENTEDNLYHEGVLDITPQELNKKRATCILIDVREPDEYSGELGHIPGTQLVPLSTLPKKLGEFPKDKTVVFICRSGGRSARATEAMVNSGHKSTYNLKGGMLLWNDLHLPTEI